MTAPKTIAASAALAVGLLAVPGAHAVEANLPAAPPVETTIKAPHTGQTTPVFIAPWTRCVGGQRELSVVAGAKPGPSRDIVQEMSSISPLDFLPLQSTMVMQWTNLTTGQSGSTTKVTGSLETIDRQIVGPGHVRLNVVKTSAVGAQGSSVPGTQRTISGNWDLRLAPC